MAKVKYLSNETKVYKGHMSVHRFCIRWCVPEKLIPVFQREVISCRVRALYGGRNIVTPYRIPGRAKSYLYSEEDMLRVYHLLQGELPKKAICPAEYMTIAQIQALFGVTAVKLNKVISQKLNIKERKFGRDGECFYKYRYEDLCLAINSLDPTAIPSDMLLLPPRRADISLIKNSSAEASIAAYKKKYKCSDVETTKDVVHGSANAGGSRLVSKGVELRLICDGEQVFTVKDYASMTQIDKLGFDCRGQHGRCNILRRQLVHKAASVGTFGSNVELYKRSDLDHAFAAACLTEPVSRPVAPEEYMSLWEFRAVCPYLPPITSAILYDVCHGRGVQVPASEDKPISKQDTNAARLLYRIDVLCSIAACWKLTPAVDLEAVMSPELKALLGGTYIYGIYTSRSKRTLKDIVQACPGKTIKVEYVTPPATPVQEPAPEPAPASEQQVPAIRNTSDVRAAVEIFAESMQSMEKIIKEQAELLRLIAKGMSDKDK